VVKRALHKFDEFLIWTFQMRAGEVKKFRHQETNRGLTDHGPLTLSAISVFVTGRFATIRHGREPYIHEAGTGGSDYLDADSFLGHSLVCLEDGEYHCITPVGPPKFWNRSVHSLQTNQAFFHVGEWIWDATSKKLINIEADFYFIDEPSVIARMWLEPEIST
jgi:hypothetical protein